MTTADNTVFVVRSAHPNFVSQNFTNTSIDSQNDALLEPLWGSHFGYRDADERKASADVVWKFFFVIGGCEASLRLSADERLKPKCPFGALRSSAARYMKCQSPSLRRFE